MRKRISQREAHSLRKRVEILERAIERQRASYSQEWFGGVNITSAELHQVDAAAIRTARRLSHAVVVIGDESNTVKFMALPQSRADQQR